GVWGDILSNASASDSPAVAAWGPTRVDLVYRGADGQLNWTFDTSTWKTPVSLGGIISTSPAIAAEHTGRAMVVALGTDSNMWRRTYQQARGDWDGDG